MMISWKTISPGNKKSGVCGSIMFYFFKALSRQLCVVFNGAKLSMTLKHCSPANGGTGNLSTRNIPLATTVIPASRNYHSN